LEEHGILGILTYMGTGKSKRWAESKGERRTCKTSKLDNTLLAFQRRPTIFYFHVPHSTLVLGIVSLV
jgi:hypothetical protein